MPALGLFGAQALGLSLRLIGIVVNDGVLQVKGDGFYLAAQNRAPMARIAGKERPRKLAAAAGYGNGARRSRNFATICRYDGNVR